MLENLFIPYMLDESIELRNRIIMAPMTTWSSQPDGQVSLEELDYYRHRSTGVGMVITGTTYVTPNGMGFENQFYAGDDLYIKSLERLAQAIHQGGAKAVLQVFHAGRMTKASLIGGNQIESASAVKAERPDAEVPRALEEKEIYNILDAFYSVTKRAIAAGFDGIEIHGANTYLIQQFFSPHSNRREDYWGGDVESRMRFPVAVISSVKRAVMESKVKNFIIGYRLSPEEHETPGIRLDDTLKFVHIIADMDLTYLNLSLSKYNMKSQVNTRERIPMGVKIMRMVGDRMPVIGVGGIVDAESAQDALELGYNMIEIGRSLVMNPDWVERVQLGQPLRQTLNLQDSKELYIPKGLRNRIAATKGWFPLED